MSFGLEWQGENLVLLPTRAIWWPRQEMLLVSDLHLGKDAAFRAAGSAVPNFPTHDTLARLNNLINIHSPKRLVILGDLFHDQEALKGSSFHAFNEWLTSQKDIDIQLVLGNHDRLAMGKTDSVEMHEEIECQPFTFRHAPSKADCHVVCGHIHPGYRLEGRGRQIERLSCFWLTEHYTVLPAFGTFTGNYMVNHEEKGRVFVIAGTQIFEVKVQDGVRRPEL